MGLLTQEKVLGSLLVEEVLTVRARATAQGAALLLLMALLVLSVLPRPLRYQDGHARGTDNRAINHIPGSSRARLSIRIPDNALYQTCRSCMSQLHILLNDRGVQPRI
ncbi:unnamed protein product [Lampetra planeri]